MWVTLRQPSPAPRAHREGGLRQAPAQRESSGVWRAPDCGRALATAPRSRCPERSRFRRRPHARRRVLRATTRARSRNRPPSSLSAGRARAKRGHRARRVPDIFERASRAFELTEIEPTSMRRATPRTSHAPRGTAGRASARLAPGRSLEDRHRRARDGRRRLLRGVATASALRSSSRRGSPPRRRRASASRSQTSARNGTSRASRSKASTASWSSSVASAASAQSASATREWGSCSRIASASLRVSQGRPLSRARRAS